MNLDDNTKRWLAWAAITLVTILVSTFLGVSYPIPEPPIFDSAVAFGTTHFTNVEAEDVTVTDDLTVADGVAISGDTDLNGNKLDLDADADTSIEADTDDQIDFEIAGVDTVVMKDFSTAAAVTVTDYIVEIQGSSPAWTANTNSIYALGVDLSIGNAQTGTHVVKGVVIDAITGDAQVTETGLAVGSGWDVAADFDASVTIDGGVTNIGGGTPAVAAGDNDLFVTADLEVDGEIEADGTVDIDGAVSIDSDLTFGEVSAQTLGAGAVISSTGVYIPLNSGAAITCNATTCIEAGAVAGEIIILVNENASDAITIDGTGGTVECKANVALGADDTLVLMWDGADWRCLSNYDNS